LQATKSINRNIFDPHAQSNTFTSPMDMLPYAIDIQKLVFHYGQRLALDELDLRIAAGQIFALLGPNGSGKSTLFRILATLEQSWQGQVQVLGCQLQSQQVAIRQKLGVVFQSPSLDKKLTVQENLRCQAVLYGLNGRSLKSRIDEVGAQLGIRDRMQDRVETLSGGLKRRVELAKGMLHRPQLLLLDEPSTGLDPAARLDLWRALTELHEQHQVSVVLTTHLLEEADKAHQIAILDKGRCVASGGPDELRGQLGSQILSVQTQIPEPVVQWLEARNLSVQHQGHRVQVAGVDVAALVAPLCQAHGDKIAAVTVGRPSLEDVFIAKTGHTFWNETTEVLKP
jgi:ABC-2 type transport system ATP-binding protein